jgi:ribosomal protein L16 Arg81 hydroxylase
MTTNKLDSSIFREQIPCIIDDIVFTEGEGCFKNETFLKELNDQSHRVNMKSVDINGVTEIYKIDSVKMISSYFDLFHKKNKLLSFYISGMDKSHEVINRTRNKLGEAFKEKQIGVKVSLSFHSSGAYLKPHIDFFDAIIVQVSGSRICKIWDKSKTDIQVIKAVTLGDYSNVWQGFNKKPIAEIELTPGKAIYIPAYYPHFINSLVDNNETSISCAMSWRVKSVLSFLNEILSEEEISQVKEINDPFLIDKLDIDNIVRDNEVRDICTHISEIYKKKLPHFLKEAIEKKINQE